MTTPRPLRSRSGPRALRKLRAAVTRRETQGGRLVGRRSSRECAPGHRGGGCGARRAATGPATGDPCRPRRRPLLVVALVLGLLVCLLDAVPARPPLPRAPWRPPAAAGASPPPRRPSSHRSRRTGSSPTPAKSALAGDGNGDSGDLVTTEKHPSSLTGHLTPVVVSAELIEVIGGGPRMGKSVVAASVVLLVGWPGWSSRPWWPPSRG
jgi:hypothetical protein